MGSDGGSDSPYPWGNEGNYWGWVDRRARMLHDCPYCGIFFTTAASGGVKEGAHAN